MSCSRVGSNIDTPTTNTIFFFFGIELAQMKLDELVKDVTNLDIKKESMDDNRGHSQD